MRAVLLLFVAVLTFIPCAAWSQGNPLGPEFRVNTYTTNDQTQPSIAIDAAGNFVVVWESYYSFFEKGVFGQRYASSGAPLGAEFPVGSPPGVHAAPAVGADPGGNFVVIWQFSPLTGTSLTGRRFASSGAPLGGQFSIATSGYSYNAAVARDPAANFVVAWTGNFPGDGSGRGVFARRFAGSGVPLSSQFRVNTYTTLDQSLPSVAADSSGNFVVVWSSNSQDGSGLGIFGQRYASSGAPLGSEFRVNTFTASDQRSPSVAADASGNFVVAWHGLGSGYEAGVFGQRYDSSGMPLGGEFRVNTNTTFGQVQPSVAADPSGNFVVVWAGNHDGWGYGIFGQRFAPILPVELMQFRVE